MQSKDKFFSGQAEKFLSHKSRTHLFIISVLFIAAFAIRVYPIYKSPRLVGPRQYRCAIIARDYFFETLQSIPDWERKIASINKDAEGIYEPPIMELLASLGYRIAGGEYLWIPKMLSVIFWLGGGVFLYALTRGLISSAAAIFSTAFYLFLPFGIAYSQSFAPDPLMLCLFIASIWAISRYHIQPSRTRLAIATALSAAAMFVKPVCLFAIFATFILANISRQGIRKTLTDLNFILFGIGSFLPTALFYFYGIYVGTALRDVAEQSFFPSLYFSTAFWLGWLNQIDIVIGSITFILALWGVSLFREGLPRALILGLWIGYVLFCLTFNEQIHSYGYWNLQLIPIVALSIAPVADLILSHLAQTWTQWQWRLAFLGLFLFLSLVSIREVRREIRSKDPFPVKVAQEIGAITQHSTNTILLSEEYGKILKYYGEISGKVWPSPWTFIERQIKGQPIPTAKERLDSLIRQFSPRYFIITAFEEYEDEQDLKQYLEGAFPIAKKTSDYLIFDLKKTKHLNE